MIQNRSVELCVFSVPLLLKYSLCRQSNQLFNIVMTPPTHGHHSNQVQAALLASVAKAILLQAETEVTAEKRSALPLAQVTANLMTVLDNFEQTFWCKLVQRAGGWPVPIVVPAATDIEGIPWPNEGERRKAMGFRDSDAGEADYIRRTAGIMRVYFAVLWSPVNKKLHAYYTTSRYWEWFSRILAIGNEELLGTATAAEVIYSAFPCPLVDWF